jgi:hypothetical protein
MGATLRKIGLKQGLTLALFSVALTGGLAMALHTLGRDPREAAGALVPVFIGSLAATAGVNPVRSPLLMALVAAGAAGLMWGTQLLVG